MKDLTIIEWLEEKRLTDREIDFLLTLIPGLSTLWVDKSKRSNVFTMLKNQFTDFPVSEDIDYLQFNNLNLILQENLQGKISTDDLLQQLSQQRICKPISDFILASVHEQ
ncbi:hypothetical protein [Bacillus gaemokensis]|uniref:Uncharacterized protein n=1 Tax=Bacillus gaemokensis TaxID=574375 RepID=A0A073KFG6_9BACI|nr:hypothetical protein [Bacillus gaemokensis]KEK25261.1 hypothetical protein BAGA_11560 [Bacillus gaemokensis]KYG37296.1 hypothetical protein AZF08_07780 [Bacillus gaemokensis]